jgi:hypothetical protein
MPPKAMRRRPSETLRTPLKRRMLVANERRRAKMSGLQRMRLAGVVNLLEVSRGRPCRSAYVDCHAAFRTHVSSRQTAKA